LFEKVHRAANLETTRRSEELALRVDLAVREEIAEVDERCG
jgi:hypothetical protein